MSFDCFFLKISVPNPFLLVVDFTPNRFQILAQQKITLKSIEKLVNLKKIEI